MNEYNINNNESGGPTRRAILPKVNPIEMHIKK